MKQGSTLYLKLIILLMAVAVTAGLLWFPQTEGRAAHLDLVQIYADPLVLYTYIAAIPFFYGLFQAFSLLNLIEANKAFSQASVNILRNTKYAGLTLIALIIGGLILIRFFAQGDDPAGPTMLGICMALAIGVISTAAGVFQKLFQNALDMKSENDLTV